MPLHVTSPISGFIGLLVIELNKQIPEFMVTRGISYRDPAS